MNPKEYKDKIEKSINMKYSRQKPRKDALGQFPIALEEAVSIVRNAHPKMSIWNCQVINEKYVFLLGNGPVSRDCFPGLFYYVDCKNGDTGYFDTEGSFELLYKFENKDIVWIDLSPEELSDNDWKVRKLRENLLAVELLEEE